MHALKTCQTFLAPLGTPRNQAKAPDAFLRFALHLGISPLPSSVHCLLLAASGHKHHPQGSLHSHSWLQGPSRISLATFRKKEPFLGALGTGSWCLTWRDSPHLLDSLCNRHWSEHHRSCFKSPPRDGPCFCASYSERTVLWEKLAALVWHLHHSSPFPLSPTASRDAPVYCRSYHQIMQQRTCGCSQRCSRSPEKLGIERRGSRKPNDLWICDMEDICMHVCERERERECLLLQLL